MDIKWLDKDSMYMDEVDLIDWLTKICKPEQTGIIMDHIKLLDSNMLIGFDETDVYVMFVDYENNEVLKITKSK